jgi:hypothetical protein
MLTGKCIAQMQFGFTMPKGINKVEIPFVEANNLIVIPVVINNFLKLNFILDTGVETPILTEIAYANILGIEYIREVVISGPGIVDSVRALIGQKVNIKLPGNVTGYNLNLLVLQEDYLKLSEKMGMDVQGIIGYDIFQKFVVEIDYDENMIILHRPSKYRPKKKFESISLNILQSKPYIQSHINQNKVSDTIQLLIDTGASHALLLDVDQTNISLPNRTIPTRLGTGLGGEIPGQLGRLDLFGLNNFEFKEVIVSIPTQDAYSQLIKRGSRQGTLGGDVLSRLHPVFDYSNEILYLSKSKKYKEKFEYDMSGLSLSSRGTFLDSLYIDHVRDGSPADLAGIRENDIILNINGYNHSYHPMSIMLAILRKKPKNKIRMKILRGDEKLKKVFRLKRTI